MSDKTKFDNFFFLVHQSIFTVVLRDIHWPPYDRAARVEIASHFFSLACYSIAVVERNKKEPFHPKKKTKQERKND